jgi:hypothetical protein
LRFSLISDYKGLKGYAAREIRFKLSSRIAHVIARAIWHLKVTTAKETGIITGWQALVAKTGA